MPAASCDNCGTRLPTDSRFCPECGVRIAGANAVTAVEEVPPEETGRVPVHVTAAAPRYFGVTPPLAVFGLAVASLAFGIVVLLAGRVVIGALLLAAAVLFAFLFVAAARRLPQAAVSRLSARAVAEVRGRTGFAAEALRVHSSTRVELFRLRREVLELLSRRAEAARELGEAVYGGADQQAEEARNRMRELDEALAAKEGEMTKVAAEARERLTQAQLQVQPTEVVEPPQVPEPMPVPSEPPQPITVPEPSPVPSEPPMPAPAPDPTPEPAPPMPEPPTPGGD